jgi:hypothetical protein
MSRRNLRVRADARLSWWVSRAFTLLARCRCQQGGVPLSRKGPTYCGGAFIAFESAQTEGGLVKNPQCVTRTSWNSS